VDKVTVSGRDGARGCCGDAADCGKDAAELGEVEIRADHAGADRGAGDEGGTARASGDGTDHRNWQECLNTVT